RKLQLRGKSGVLIVKLMMACNDLQLANEALDVWAEEQPRNRKYREVGARIYFIRLQFAHLYEALGIVDEIRRDSDLMRMIEQRLANPRLFRPPQTLPSRRLPASMVP